jgi:hypothetical protein
MSPISIENIITLSWIYVIFTGFVFAFGWKMIERRGVIETRMSDIV